MALIDGCTVGRAVASFTHDIGFQWPCGIPCDGCRSRRAEIARFRDRFPSREFGFGDLPHRRTGADGDCVPRLSRTMPLPGREMLGVRDPSLFLAVAR